MKAAAVVVGGGHAGVEAALALARRGHRTILVTARTDALGLMPCNPAIGGLAKSHLVVELDALGGEMGLNADLTGLQYRTLNASRGPAVRATRIQCDKQQYARRLARVAAATPNLTLLCDRVLAIRTAHGRVEAIETAAHGTIPLAVLVLTTGTALGGRIYLGQTIHPGGGDLRPGHTRLTESLRAAGIPLKRLKTGTPPRLWSRSIDWSRLTPQPSDNPIPLFSLRARIARDTQTPFDTVPWNRPPSTWNNLNGYATHLLPHADALPPAGKVHPPAPTLCTPTGAGLSPSCIGRTTPLPLISESPSAQTPPTSPESPSEPEPPSAPLSSSGSASVPLEVPLGGAVAESGPSVSTSNCSTWNNEAARTPDSAPFLPSKPSNPSHNAVDRGKTISSNAGSAWLGQGELHTALPASSVAAQSPLGAAPSDTRPSAGGEALRSAPPPLDGASTETRHPNGSEASTINPSPLGGISTEAHSSAGGALCGGGGVLERLDEEGVSRDGVALAGEGVLGATNCSTWNNWDPVLPWIGLRVGIEGLGEVVGEGIAGRFAAPWQPGEVDGACYLTHTTERTHAIIRAHLGESAMYNGEIKGRGVRYCPSIEDKVVKFADKSEHHVVLEPEGRDCPWVYPNGLSNCLPFEVQVELVRSVPGLERAEFAAPGYAIEYDCIDSRALDSSLACRTIPNLFFAGQVNGTTGYEEAAAQGLMAGINAGRLLEDAAPVVLSRQDAYIGVLIDDLVVKGADEPYRMFTSRAERRLILRQDNAHRRLLKVSREVGLAEGDLLSRTARMEAWIADETARLDRERLDGAPLSALLARPGVGYLDLPGANRGVPPDWIEALEVELRYRGYVEQELRAAERAKLQEQRPIPPWLDYWRIPALRWESREKLHAVRPANLAQAAAVPGVTPADIAILALVIKSGRNPV
ncbi:MAG: FAD-dependent oxidoreductase [Kiritimatiellia bacterium]|nr:FAD-dependent oxidoreductase [Kiritimatiellia bacterium]